MQLLWNFVEFLELLTGIHEIPWVAVDGQRGRRGSAEVAPRSAMDARQKALFYKLWRHIILHGISRNIIEVSWKFVNFLLDSVQLPRFS